jgi:hypothetical protein
MMKIIRNILFITTIITLFYSGYLLANAKIIVCEVLSIKTGENINYIGNQFANDYIRPFNGFAVDSKGNILISDIMNARIMRFTKGGKPLEVISVQNNNEDFWPESICVDKDDNLYVHNSLKNEIVMFQTNGKVLFPFNTSSVFNHTKYNYVPIISLSSNEDHIVVAYGPQPHKVIQPVYVDEYNKEFNLISRKVYDDELIYSDSKKDTSKKFEKHFEDSKGNVYGYPVVEHWYGKFLPLQKYSSTGVLLNTIDGKILTEKTKIKIFDYFTRPKDHSWIDVEGQEFMIVNWYVYSNGDINALLANKDYVKVLRIEEKD